MRDSLLDSNCFEGTSDGDPGSLNVTFSQEFVDNPECHHRIRPLDRV
jgi:hypothetical protein